MEKMKIALLVMIVLSLIGCQTETIKKEIYLIPENFIGSIIVIYDQPDGIKDSIINDRVIYKIPKTGVLYLKGHQHLQEFKDIKYYYYPSKTINKRICDYFEKDTAANCYGIVWNNYLASFQKNLKSKRYEYAVILIGTKDSIPPDFDPVSFQFKK
jgi:hypothetical protein